MSSYTKATFATEIQSRSPILATFAALEVQDFIDLALRAFSLKRKYRKVSADNAVIEDQDLYDFPADALRIDGILNSADQMPIHFTVVDEGTGQKIRLGELQTRSMRDLLHTDYYRDPLSYQSAVSIGSYEEFDIVYFALHDMDSISDDWLEALYWYVEYLGANYKAGESIVAVEDSAQEEIESLTDTDATGAATTVKFSTTSGASSVWGEQALKALATFNDLTKTRGYGIRG